MKNAVTGFRRVPCYQSEEVVERVEGSEAARENGVDKTCTVPAVVALQFLHLPLPELLVIGYGSIFLDAVTVYWLYCTLNPARTRHGCKIMVIG